MHGVVDLRLHDLLRQRDLGLLEQVSRALSRICSACWTRFTRSHLIGEAGLELVDGVEFACQLGEFVVGLGQLAFLHRVDRDGHLRLFAGVLARDQRGGEDLGLPLLDRPTIASSRPSISWPEPTSWDSPSVAASGTSLPSTVADRSIETKSPFCAGALDTGQRAEPGAQVLQLGVDVLVGHLDRVDGDLQRLRSGMVISGRMSTSAVKTRSSLSSSLVISISGCPSGRTSEVVTASL